MCLKKLEFNRTRGQGWERVGLAKKKKKHEAGEEGRCQDMQSLVK